MEFWANNFFDGARVLKEEDMFIYYMMHLVAITLGFFLGLLVFGFPLSFFMGDTGIPIGGVIGIIPALIVPRLGWVYKGRGLPKSGYSYYYDGYRGEYNFPDRAQEYFSLSKEDRRSYPANILELMRDPDLTHEQRAQLDKTMRELYNDIQERNRQRRLVTKRNVDITPYLEHMEDQRPGIKEQTKTYKELA